MRYWLAVISKEHTLRGVHGGFVQVCHGKEAPLRRMKKDDWLIVYSSKLTMTGTEKIQSFTAIGQVADNHIYPFKMSEDFIPYRRNMVFYDCAEVSILPLVNDLEFIQNKKSWGYPFRFGFLEIKENDFKLIHSKMFTDSIEKVRSLY